MLLKNASAFINDSHFERCDIAIEDGKVKEIGHFPGAEGVDLSGKILVPGLIDIHTHGREGYDFADAVPEAVQTITRSHLKQGVTSILATTVTHSEEMIFKMLKNIASTKVADGAEILGINLEGPFISSKACGAQPIEHCINPDLDLFHRFQEAAGGKIKLVTVAPELPLAMEFIKKCGVAVSAGHTKASHLCFHEALNNGLRSITHLFNGMPPMHHREPGVLTAALLGDNYAEIICDYIHVEPTMITLAYKLKGAKKLVMISDSMSGAGLSDGEYIMGGHKVFVQGGIARIENGSLAGSTCSLSENFRKMWGLGIPPEDITRMCTSTPAALLGIKNKGIIAQGKDADLVAFNYGYSISAVYKAGKRVV